MGTPADMMPLGGEEFDWDSLLDYISDPNTRVIPVVGNELLWVPCEVGAIPLERHLGRALLDTLGVDPSGLPEPLRLTDAVLRCLDSLGQRKRHRIYSQLKTLATDPALPVPVALRKLAEITDFDLFLSVTFDSLLRRALDQVRFGGSGHTRALAYAPIAQPEDLPEGMAALDGPHVFHLFGLAGATPEFAVTDEDYLEFVHCLQSEPRPERLFDELRYNHLLIVGCGFEDWLQRFLVRVLTNERLRKMRDTATYVAEARPRQEERLALFLNQYGADLFLEGDPLWFVDELHRRWTQRRSETPSPAAPNGAPAKEMEPGSLFVSFANADRAAARSLKASLEQAGLDVWLDEQELEPGIDWEPYIRRRIADCAVFIPLLSRNAQHKKVGYFRVEWREGIKRDGYMAESRRFIQPVALDNLGRGAEDIPDYFWDKQVSHFPKGDPSPEFVSQLKDLVRRIRLEGDGRI